jgi:RNA polymerase sigma-70 factor (ECF subfamily)
MMKMESPLRRDESVLLDLARSGDESAYRELIETHRSELHAHCYRMLASVEDADDAVQDTLLRAWRSIDQFEGRSSVRTWLYRIATNASIDLSKSRTRRELSVGMGPATHYGDGFQSSLLEQIWIEPYPDNRYPTPSGTASPEARYELRESLELAFVTALQVLPAKQRAALLLREVLGYSAIETAQLLGSSAAAVNSSLQRARAALATHLPARSQQSELHALGDVRLRELSAHYCDAIERGDIAALLALLNADATWAMPPVPTWFQGHEDISAFHLDDIMTQPWRHIVVQSNCQLAVAGYIVDESRQCFVATVIDVLTLENSKISSVTGFIASDLKGFERTQVFPRFGLPLELPL